MSKMLIPVLLVVVVLVLGGWLLAQQPGAPGLPGAAGGQGVPGQPGKPPPHPETRFTVSGSGEGAVMVESPSGKSWLLHRLPSGGYSWLPVRRIDSEVEAKKML